MPATIVMCEGVVTVHSLSTLLYLNSQVQYSETAAYVLHNIPLVLLLLSPVSQTVTEVSALKTTCHVKWMNDLLLICC